jgi:uncharacterized membrane protein SpoIIM required for sporulation
MVLESILNPAKAERKPVRLMLLGFIYCTVAIFLGYWIFKNYSSLIMVFLTAMASIPLIVAIVKYEEEKDLQDLSEKMLIKEHGKALSAFMFLFLGFTIAIALWYVVLPSHIISVLFSSQTETIQSINGRITGLLSFDQFSIFSKIFLNNVKVLIFCILFSFIYGAGAIFILTWNASVIGTAIGNYVRSNIALYAGNFGLAGFAKYFEIITLGLFRYAIHGIPEIFAYFTAGLAGGIISVAVIRHDFGTRKFEHILLDSADLLLLSLGLLFVASLLEVFVTPLLF